MMVLLIVLSSISCAKRKVNVTNKNTVNVSQEITDEMVDRIDNLVDDAMLTGYRVACMEYAKKNVDCEERAYEFGQIYSK